MYKLFVKILVLTNVSLLFFTAQVYALQNTQVVAELCDSTGPSVTVNQPISDSIVNNPSVVLTGEAFRTSQLDVYINNQYNNSIAITTNPVFQTGVTLSPGTNTIRLEASYACNNTSASTSVVVGYQPTITSPSSPLDTITTIQSVQKNNTSQTPEEDDVPKRIIHKLGLGNKEFSTTDDYVAVIGGWLNLGIILILIAWLFWTPAYLVRLILAIISRFIDVSFSVTRWILRILAIFVIVVLTVIFIS